MEGSPGGTVLFLRDKQSLNVWNMKKYDRLCWEHRIFVLKKHYNEISARCSVVNLNVELGGAQFCIIKNEEGGGPCERRQI